MKTSHKFFISLIIACFVLYLGGWRIVLSSSSYAKVSQAVTLSLTDESTRIGESFIANGDLNVYVYKNTDGELRGLMNLYRKNYGDFFMILALLVVAIPFGVFII